ncbi:hypothetical protein ACFVJS_00685 [Nocardioides sp. NPDC057772]|uniref:hypothetical protein n=1 Tax=Nocardioides sp. NPDC057772 TaxID=3346245 RepID=UPI00366A6878
MDDDFPAWLALLVRLCAAVAGFWGLWCIWVGFFGGTMPLIGVSTDGSLLLGLFMLFIGEPILLTVAYWAFALLLFPVALLVNAVHRQRPSGRVESWDRPNPVAVAEPPALPNVPVASTQTFVPASAEAPKNVGHATLPAARKTKQRVEMPPVTYGVGSLEHELGIMLTSKHANVSWYLGPVQDDTQDDSAVILEADLTDRVHVTVTSRRGWWLVKYFDVQRNGERAVEDEPTGQNERRRPFLEAHPGRVGEVSPAQIADAIYDNLPAKFRS